MTNSILILGRLPALGRAELESLLGSDSLTPVANGTAVLAAKPPDQLDLTRLGGSVKLAKHLTTLPTTEWAELVGYLAKSLPDHIGYIPDGKIRLGLSVYGLPVRPEKINQAGLALKKIIKAAGRSVRVVPNKSNELNSAQVLHNQLTGPTGLELVLIANGSETLLARTVAVQDIDAYAARDQRRPKRDARVGMLPPKLAQTIVNLAAGGLKPEPNTVVLDPFCGTGVILQEALLMGYSAYGTDLEKRMIEFSQANLDWLTESHSLSLPPFTLETGDATEHRWTPLPAVIAAETYLGKPFSSRPGADELRQVIHDVNVIHRKFLQNIARQTPPGFRLCVAVPAWVQASGFIRLPTLDHLEELGYTRVSFVHAGSDELIYHREGQIVARELVILTRT